MGIIYFFCGEWVTITVVGQYININSEYYAIDPLFTPEKIKIDKKYMLAFWESWLRLKSAKVENIQFVRENNVFTLFGNNITYSAAFEYVEPEGDYQFDIVKDLDDTNFRLVFNDLYIYYKCNKPYDHNFLAIKLFSTIFSNDTLSKIKNIIQGDNVDQCDENGLLLVLQEGWLIVSEKNNTNFRLKLELEGLSNMLNLWKDFIEQRLYNFKILIEGMFFRIYYDYIMETIEFELIENN